MTSEIGYLKTTDDDNYGMELTWNSGYRGAISPNDDIPGKIEMKAGAVPRLLYTIAKTMDDFSFMNENTKKSIIGSDKKEFRKHSYDNMTTAMELDLGIYRVFWSGIQNTEDGPPRKFSENELRIYRHRYNMSEPIEFLKNIGIDSADTEYLAIIFNEFVLEPIHVIAMNSDVYLSQQVTIEKKRNISILPPKRIGVSNMVRLDEDEKINLINAITNFYEERVSAIIKPFLI
jgi:hypothetical protein